MLTHYYQGYIKANQYYFEATENSINVAEEVEINVTNADKDF